MNYRPEIDGLRAIAVLAVVFFHLEFAGSASGLVGVDVFFVISGFLVTRILCDEAGRGALSIAGFYERRARRIFPALFVVLAVSAVLAWRLLPPPDLRDFGWSLGATSLFVSNLYFMTGAGYFADTTRLAPLVHTWSLAVEEQFYLVLPIVLWACRRWLKSRYVAIFAGLAIVSFAAAVLLATRSEKAAFYFGAARAWELLLGGILAAGAWAPPERRWIRELGAALGTGAILAAVLGLIPGSGEGPAGLLAPCFGTALVIWSAPRPADWMGAALGWRPLTAVGLISYSLYLWHWPLAVFYKATLPLESASTLSLMSRTLLLGLSLSLAALTWRSVERPFRRRLAGNDEARFAREIRVLRASLAAMLAAVLIGGVFVVTRGLMSRAPERAQAFFDYESYRSNEWTREGRCFLLPQQTAADFDWRACLASRAGAPDDLIAGDSLAAHLRAGLSEAMPDASWLQATASGCRPLVEPARGPRCADFMHDVLAGWVPRAHPAAVVLAGRWTEGDIAPLQRTIANLPSSIAHIVVLGPIVEYRLALPRVLALASWHERPSLVDDARATGIENIDARMAAALAGGRARYISLFRALCPSRNHCDTVTPSGIPIQFDQAHLTEEGSRLLAHRIAPLFADTTR